MTPTERDFLKRAVDARVRQTDAERREAEAKERLLHRIDRLRTRSFFQALFAAPPPKGTRRCGFCGKRTANGQRVCLFHADVPDPYEVAL